MALTPRPGLKVGALALYHGVGGHRVKVRVTQVTREDGRVLACSVVTARTDRLYRKGEVIWSSPAWLTDRRGMYFGVPCQPETEVA